MIATKEQKKPLVAICMATFNPPMRLLSRQIESIRKQSHPHWVCIISDDHSSPEIFQDIKRIVGDDKRFHVHRADSNLGFYHNFERCLTLVPKGAQFVALSDQDDYWHPDKLETLLSQFDSETTLVYSDMNIIDENQHLISESFWTTRRNNFRSLASLLITNTITGAASVFRSSLLEYILPFPPRIGDAYHDHWIGCVALAMGQVKYVDRPLFDYTQHPTQVLGRTPLDSVRGTSFVKRLGKRKRTLTNAHAIYDNYVLNVESMARLLERRGGSAIPHDKMQAIRRLGSIDQSFSGLLWLALRSLRNVVGLSETLGGESSLLAGILWKRLSILRNRPEH